MKETNVKRIQTKKNTLDKRKEGGHTLKTNGSSVPQPADRLEVHPRGGGADQSLPGRLQRGGSSGVASLF